jgi:glycosyltransferase involved in cell wall biosynthesis
MKRDSEILSIIIPVYNEEDTIPELVARLDRVCSELSLKTEKIFVDNRSTDSSPEIIRGVIAVDKSYRMIRFSRNFGPSVEASITAGYRLCQGDAAVVLYSDLQDPPELIPEMVRLWRDGYDVVYSVQTQRHGEPLWRRLAVKTFYRLLQRLAESSVPANAGDYRLVSRQVLNALADFPERARYTRGLVSWVGFKQIAIPYQRQPRFQGKSKANVFAITRTALLAITSFSLYPLRALTGLGFACAAISFSAIVIYALIFFFGVTVPGLTTLITIMLFSLGVTTASIGLLGEYVGKILTEAKMRPLYVIDEVVNLDRE